MSTTDVYPTAEELSVEEPINCTFPGCGAILKSSGCLQMHMLRRHQGKSLSIQSSEERKRYYCPVSTCDRGSKKPFPRLGQLKQHFQTMHSDKKFSCEKCGRHFGLRDVCKRHEAECGRVFSCLTCSENFRSRNALYQHAKRRSHAMPETSRSKNSRNETSSSDSASRRSVSKHDISVQTMKLTPDDQYTTDSSPLLTNSGSQTNQTLLDMGTCTYDINSVFFTLTQPSCAVSMASTQSCQTPILDSVEFGTQTPFPVYEILASDFGTQTLQDYNELDLDNLLPPGCLSLGTQTSVDNMDCLEFGVQTLLQAETKDQESQTHVP